MPDTQEQARDPALSREQALPVRAFFTNGVKAAAAQRHGLPCAPDLAMVGR